MSAAWRSATPARRTLCVTVSSVPPGSPFLGEDRVPADLFGPGQPGVGVLHREGDGLFEFLRVGPRRFGGGPARPGGPVRDLFGVEDDEGHVVGTGVADDDGVPDQGVDAVRTASIRAGDMTLPPVLMMRSFLRSTIRT